MAHSAYTHASDAGVTELVALRPRGETHWLSEGGRAGDSAPESARSFATA
jgi:hypothetical protein